MTTSRPIAAFAALLTLTVHPARSGAQEPRRALVAEYRGASSGATTPAPFDEPRAPSPELTRADRRRWDAASATAGRLVVNSADSFRRGLLPLSDHLQHLALTCEIESGAERAGQDLVNPLHSRAAQQRIARLSDVVALLEQFQQPAAAGWAADLALSRLVLSRAISEAAAQRGKTSAAPPMTSAEQHLAAEQYELRLWDAEMGLAGPPALVAAAAWLNVSPELKRDFLEQVVAATQEWHDVGAGIGREDRLFQARLDLALLDAAPRETYDGPAVDRRAVRESDDYAARLFDARLRFYSAGTASLHDLSEAWLVRRRLHQAAAAAPSAVTPDMQAKREHSLTRLVQLADGTADLRGRHAADVAFVHLLQQWDQLIGSD
jgi:hypothetical protein